MPRYCPSRTLILLSELVSERNSWPCQLLKHSLLHTWNLCQLTHMSLSLLEGVDCIHSMLSFRRVSAFGEGAYQAASAPDMQTAELEQLKKHAFIGRVQQQLMKLAFAGSVWQNLIKLALDGSV